MEGTTLRDKKPKILATDSMVCIENVITVLHYNICGVINIIHTLNFNMTYIQYKNVYKILKYLV